MTGLTEVAATATLSVRLSELLAKLRGSNKLPQEMQEIQMGLLSATTQAVSAERHTLTLEKRITELEAEIQAFHDWKAEAEKYVTKEIARGVFAAVAKDNQGPLKSALKLCSNCFEQRQKSILQYKPIELGRMDSLVCSRCKAVLVFRGWSDGPPLKEHVPVLA